MHAPAAGRREGREVRPDEGVRDVVAPQREHRAVVGPRGGAATQRVRAPPVVEARHAALHVAQSWLQLRHELGQIQL